MPRFAGLQKFFGKTVSEGAAFAAGSATARTLHPGLQDLTNEAWKRHAVRPLDAGTAAAIVAEDVDGAAWGRDEANLTGVSDGRFDRLLAEALNAPGVSELRALWRRGLIDAEQFEHGLRKAKLETRWTAPLKATKTDPLDASGVAAAIHRGLIPDPGLLKGEQPGSHRKVEQYPVYPIDALHEAASDGVDRDRLGVLVGLQGLPMGPHEAAQALFRGIITHDDYIAAFNESNNRNEWAAAVLEQSRQIPTARDFFENALRGYHDFAWALEQSKRHGMSEADATLIYQNQGRPMALHQITTGLARGGQFKPEPGEITDPFMASIVEGSLKPAYYDLALANRYTLPGTFAIRQLVASGDLSEQEGRTLLLQSGWEPELAGKVAAKWARGGSSASKESTATDLLALYDGERLSEPDALAALRDLGYSADDAQRKIDLVAARRVASAKNAAVATLHTDFKKGNITAGAALAALAKLGSPEWAAAAIVAAWQVPKDAES